MKTETNSTEVQNEVEEESSKGTVDKEEREMDTCQYCGQNPCFVIEIYELLVKTGEELEEEELTNKQIRFNLYRIASNTYHGRLGAGNRKRLPICVTTDIHDLYLDGKGQYTGFRQQN